MLVTTTLLAPALSEDREDLFFEILYQKFQKTNYPDQLGCFIATTQNRAQKSEIRSLLNLADKLSLSKNLISTLYSEQLHFIFYTFLQVYSTKNRFFALEVITKL